MTENQPVQPSRLGKVNPSFVTISASHKKPQYMHNFTQVSFSFYRCKQLHLRDKLFTQKNEVHLHLVKKDTPMISGSLEQPICAFNQLRPQWVAPLSILRNIGNVGINASIKKWQVPSSVLQLWVPGTLTGNRDN